MKLPFRALLCTAGMSAALGVLSPISALAATDAAAQPADTPSAEIQLETEAEPEISLLGEQAIDGRWYYFDTITGKMRVGWKYLENGDKWVWYGSDGAMLYGNQVVDDGRTIHFDTNTGAAQIPVTERQRRVADQAKRCDTYGLSGGWCQAWISRTYRRAGESADSRACAYEAMRAWRVSTSRGGIPVGATVYSKSRSGSHGWTNGVYYEDYGHVGIYVGGSQVASLMYGLVYLEPVEVWTESDGYFGWGWNGGIAL